MTDDASLTALRHRLTGVRDSMSDVHMTVPDSAIFTSARKHRTRRGLAAGLTAACAALALALALVLPGGQARAVHVHLAAWSVDTNSNGTVTVTVHELTHPALLARVLGEAGVPAVVAVNAGCLNPHNQGALAQSGALRSGRAGVVIHPPAIPGHSRILFSLITISTKYTRVWSPGTGWQHVPGKPVTGFGWGLVSNGTPLHCASPLHDAKYYYSGTAH
jgi:hypothetical protein